MNWNNDFIQICNTLYIVRYGLRKKRKATTKCESVTFIHINIHVWFFANAQLVSQAKHKSETAERTSAFYLFWAL